MKLDRNLENVLSFMERNVESRKLLSIAEAIGLLAPVLWADVGELKSDRLVSLSECNREQLSTAKQSALGPPCAHDGSEVAGDSC